MCRPIHLSDIQNYQLFLFNFFAAKKKKKGNRVINWSTKIMTYRYDSEYF